MHRTMLVIATAVLILIVLVGVARTPQLRASTPFDARMRYLITWIAARTNYSPNVPLPRLRLVPREQINYRYYSRTKEGYRGQVDTIALYDNFWRTVILPTSFIMRWDEPILVHELVHHLQTMHRRRFRCQEEREREAYLIQRRYVQETGIGAMPAWGLILSLHCRS